MILTTDLHSHILPGIDDGSPDVETSLELLRREKDQGIRHIVFTPHFDPQNDTIDEFLNRRNAAYVKLQQSIQGTELEQVLDLRMAAEIRYSAGLAEMQGLEYLCITGTKVLLIEFSTRHHPPFASDVFYRLQTLGFIPLMAHIERFPWLRKDPDFLYDMVCGGAYAQVNADSIISDREGYSFIKKMLKFGLVHCIGSDTHNTSTRPPRINEAESKLTSNLGKDTVVYLNENAESLIAGRIPDSIMPSKPKNSFLDFLRK